MGAPIDRDTVAHIAHLARLHMDDAELSGMEKDLKAILGYVAKLDELDLEGVEPMAHPFMDAMRLRPDADRPGLGAEELVPRAPDPHDRFFRVPHIIGGGEE